MTDNMKKFKKVLKAIIIGSQIILAGVFFAAAWHLVGDYDVFSFEWYVIFALLIIVAKNLEK